MGSANKTLCLFIFLSFSLFSESIAATFSSFLNSSSASHADRINAHRGVQLQIQDKYVVIDNGIVELTISNPDGIIAGIKYHGVDNLLEVLNPEDNRGYWEVLWNDEQTTRKKGNFDRLVGTKFTVTMVSEEKVEVSFTRKWDPSLEGKVVPLNIDKRYVMLGGSPGFYTYAIYEHLETWPAFNIDNTRIVFKPRKDKFHYMAVADNRQRYMPLPDDREEGRAEVLAYKEAVLLVDPIEPQFNGEVDDKYQYSCESKDNGVHGWISDTEQRIGFWLITPSNEFRSGGPLKQYLTSHVGPTSIAVFHGSQYAGADMILRIGQNEPWKKVFGPIFIYLNSLSNNNPNPYPLWYDAKNQMTKEVRKWPYDFLNSQDFPRSNQRGIVRGRLLAHDSNKEIAADGAFVGLALPGEPGSWQIESKGYQFWTKTNKDGYFTINNVRIGQYNFYAWVPGFIGDYRLDNSINTRTGSGINLGNFVYNPPRNGSTLWEIGIPDRSAAEFYVPDPNPKYINKLYINHADRFRQYGLWERYTELYPDKDLVFTIGISNYKKDWFFAQVTRKMTDKSYQGTTWQIKFGLNKVEHDRTYTLRLALASAHNAHLQVRVNDVSAKRPLYSTGRIGKDNAISRHGIHGLYRVYNVDVSGTKLLAGCNTIFLTLVGKAASPFQGIMYDYIRFEAPTSF